MKVKYNCGVIAPNGEIAPLFYVLGQNKERKSANGSIRKNCKKIDIKGSF